MDLFIIIAGAAALYYVPTLLAVLKLNCSIYSLVPLKILDHSILFDLGIKITNSGKTTVTISRMNVDVLINGLKIGKIIQAYNTVIPYLNDSVIHSSFEITADNLGIDTWRDLIQIDLKNTIVTLTGTLTANGRTLPFKTDWTIKELIDN